MEHISDIIQRVLKEFAAKDEGLQQILKDATNG